MNPIYFVIIAGVFAGVYQIFRKLISSELNNYWAATIFSGVAFVVGSILIMVNKQSAFNHSHFSAKGVGLAILGGLLVFPIDYLVIKAYGQGFPVSIGALVLTGLSSAAAVSFGLILGESITIPKMAGMLLIITGIIILKYQF